MRLQQFALVFCLVTFSNFVLMGSSTKAATSLNLSQTVARALDQNRSYLAVRQEVAKAESEIGQARAGAFPQISLDANYSRSFIIPTFYLTADDETVGFKMGFKNNWDATVRLEQPIWQGGRVFTALKIAKTYKKYAEALVAQARAEVTYNAKLKFHSVRLAQAKVGYLDAALNAAIENESVVSELFDRGMVPKYDLLRAQVELANLRPLLLEAESELKLVHKNLKSFLGMDLTEELIVLSEPADTFPAESRSLDALVSLALAERPEMYQANYLVDMTGRAIKLAKGEYYPSLSAFSAYTWQSQSDAFSLTENNSRSMTAGLTLNIPIFSGGRTGGEVGLRKVDYEQAKLSARDAEDVIRLQVEQAYDRLAQAIQSLEAVKGTVEQAEEAYRIARLRFESGMGTQLEVLSSQAALTQARNSAANAEFNYNTAQAELTKATGQE